MMEKQGIVAPEVTPTDIKDAAKVAAAVSKSEEKRKAAINALDDDFRKSAAEATRKSLQ